jgi:TonB-linked SusC/RagA family outer membrane protein
MKKIIISLITVFCSLVHLQAQSLQVRGTVVDDGGEPVIGATVVEKGTLNGTGTSPDGSFLFTVSSPSATLQVSYVGFDQVEYPVSGGTLRITLTPASTAIDDVVVVGFGVQKKESVVGSISTLSPEELEKMNAPNLSTALAGKVSGITFTVPSGRPGADRANLFIRGRGTPDDASPLVLVDGVERSFDQVAPEDVASLSVLKDASATAVFGVRGANGVILITTKRGSEGKATVSMKYKYSMQQPTRLAEFLGSYEHALLRNEALANDNPANPMPFSEEDIEHYRLGDAPYTHPDNNYVSDFVRNISPMHTLNFNVSGGTKDVRYFVSLDGLSQEGIFKQFDGRYPSNSNFKRINLRANLDFSLTKTTTLSLDLNGRLQQRQSHTEGLDSNSLFSRMYETPPMAYPYKNPDGTYGASDISGVDNILSVLTEEGYTRAAENILETTVKLNQELDFLTKGLSAGGMMNFDHQYGAGTKMQYRPALFRYAGDDTYSMVREETVPFLQSSGYGGDGHRYLTYLDLGLNYNRTFGDHALTGMLTYFQEQKFVNVTDPVAHIGYAGRATYAYKGKYLAEANVGYNGSDKFPKEYRYDWFPSFALGYMISNEPWFEPLLPVVSSLKIRGSYGEVGSDKIKGSTTPYLTIYPDNAEDYFFGTDASFGGMNAIHEGNIGSDRITWEVVKKKNIGVDLEFFDDLALSVDVFNDRRESIIRPRQTIPGVLGVATEPENIGITDNKGFEVEFRYNKAFSEDFSIRVSGMYSYNRNKWIYQDEIAREYDYLQRTGRRINQFFGKTVLGYYTPDDFVMVNDVRTLRPELPKPLFNVQPGDFKYWDRNGDGAIDSFDEGDIGSTDLPAFVYNLSYGLFWKGFDFDMMWQGAGGHHKLMTKSMYEPVRENNRYQDIHRYRWTEERWRNGEEIRYPRLSGGQNNHNQATNTFYLRKGDYLRLKYFEVGYTFDERQLRFFGIGSMRVYAGGTNILTFSEIKNFDPEMGETADGTGYFYPQMKTWNIGVNINFYKNLIHK